MSFHELPGRPKAGTALCRLDEIAEDEARNFRFGGGLALFQLFLVRKAGVVRAYVNQCPHARTPLDWQSEDFFNRSKTMLLCGTHGALFRIEDGYCVRGPCPGQSLVSVPIEIVAGEIRIAEPGGRPEVLVEVLAEVSAETLPRAPAEAPSERAGGGSGSSGVSGR